MPFKPTPDPYDLTKSRNGRGPDWIASEQEATLRKAIGDEPYEALDMIIRLRSIPLRCNCPEWDQEPSLAPYNGLCVRCGKPIDNHEQPRSSGFDAGRPN